MQIIKVLQLSQTQCLDSMRLLICLVLHIKYGQIELYINLDHYLIDILGINLMFTLHQVQEEVLLELV